MAEVGGALPGGARARVGRGAARIGKAGLWRAGVARCRREGFHVLVTRPAEEEMRLPLVGLVDLLEHVAVDPVALEPGGSPLVRGRAVLEALQRMTRDAPA